jgi:hypothetical protein
MICYKEKEGFFYYKCEMLCKGMSEDKILTVGDPSRTLARGVPECQNVMIGKGIEFQPPVLY